MFGRGLAVAVQVSVRPAGKVTLVGTKSCVKVGATAEEKEGVYVDHLA